MDKEKLKEIKAGRLRDARINAGFKTLPDAVRHFKWNENTYKPHETGSRAFDEITAVSYALAFKVPLERLLALDVLEPKMRDRSPDSDDAIDLAPQPLAIHGEAAGGLWREGVDTPLDDSTNVPANPDYPASIQYARKVVGTSVSRRIPDGEYAVILHYDRSPVQLRPGLLVDVERVRAGLREHTIKVYADGERLMTDSAELDEQVELDMAHTDEDTTVRIVGIVVGKYSPLI
ncbi:hypothetical protein SAMN03159496_04677 [Rhizobium sp. NFR07]|uniref:helix-turn-helix transcriptional regulator n=1 Tax=Rhizobium sp. NFR07 TaxID=1566262 RepID=UPI0008E65625|nr:helix-turn-helix transcriptional regulator [Rhizobium sp. NFR07]SFB52656.1 hypothetical protein SAMN03159496_04677 [Rhizobium sp. NFR07]